MTVSIYRLGNRELLTLCVLALLILGVVMVQSASATVTGQNQWQWTSLGMKHLRFAIAALVTFFIVGWADYRWLARPSSSIWRSPITWLVILTAAANALVLVPHVGLRINYARRWLPLGPLQIQPSELAKWAVVIFLAWWLTTGPAKLDKFFTFVLTIIPVGLLCLLVILQDFGTATLIALCALTMLLAGKVKLRYLLLTVPPAIALGLWFMMHKGYPWKRIVAFSNPYAAPQKEGYHMIQSLLSFSTGGISGRGLGHGIQKLGYLPENTTDFIYAVICEELGLFGAMFTMALYLGILFVAWQTIKEKTDAFGKMLAFGIGSTVGLQAIINIAVATVSVPPKGLSLPLVSAGGSGLVITCAALGLLRSACRFGRQEQTVPDWGAGVPPAVS